ncbi:hypothetical protein ASF39_00305 [Methylobacterium sp. Leaf108]|nr:hypothetical protein ASF39_00305 [Methylobacterium sp. Leaf108]
MTRMPRSVLTGVVAILIATPALSVDDRWTAGFGQGTAEASIRSRTGSIFRVFCGGGTGGRRMGVVLEGLAQTAPKGRPLDVRVVVDGRTFPFAVTDGYGAVDARGGRFALEAMAKAMLASKAARFTIAYPSLNVSEAYSLGGVRDALQDRGGTILTPCL